MSTIPRMVADGSRPARVPPGPWRLRYRTLPLLTSRLRRAWALGVNRHGDVRFGPGCHLGPRFHLQMPGPGSFVAGANVTFRRDFVCEIGGDGRVEVGDGTAFTYGTVVQCSTSIRIGAHCSIGTNVFVVDGSHRFREHDRITRDQGYDFRPITIGDDVTINTGSTVISDIGDHSFIGAGSVVTRPIPAWCLAVGAPARVVEYFGPPDERPADLDPSVPTSGVGVRP